MANQSDKNKRMTVWIDKDMKDQGDKIIYDLGLTPSTVINLLYKQIVNHREIPFKMKMNNTNMGIAIKDDNGKMIIKPIFTIPYDQHGSFHGF